MEKKKQILTPAQKEQRKIKSKLRRANRTSEEVEKDKAKHKIANAKCMANRSPQKVEEQRAQRKITRALKPDKKYPLTPEQKAQRKIKKRLKLANRSLEQITEDKAKANKASAKSRAKLTPEQKEQKKIKIALVKANRSQEKIAADKAKKKIVSARCRANRSPERIEEQKASQKIYGAQYHQENKIESNKASREWHKKNPGYVSPCIIKNPNWGKEYKEEWNKTHPGYHKQYHLDSDLGYFAVYLIQNYNGLGDAYVGQTGNLYTRMSNHRKLGRLNTEAYRILQCFETREQALAFEAIQHEAGYHGYNNGI